MSKTDRDKERDDIQDLVDQYKNDIEIPFYQNTPTDKQTKEVIKSIFGDANIVLPYELIKP